ncbi:tripartite tricarboxylate transporter TctB family protein [Indioceanicola profundi]|uniref:tripartite tricarboxylate transporter TctB family protein n=1 Tax=Indioceanicola profundi TaxID=2220096 RepID=UPI000E6A9E9A|nr:tripartite tricarboxylate transporter TctB family protein [Indioceanicola profundi]
MIAIAALAGAGIALAATFFISAMSLPDTAAQLPQGLAIVVSLLAVGMIVQAWWARTHHHEKIERPGRAGPAVAFSLATIAYVAVLKFLGYFVATPIFIVGTMLFLRTLSPLKAILLAVGVSAFVWALFVWFLSLPVPMGPLE